MSTFSPEEMEHAQKVLASVRDEWLQREGVTAVDLGFKWSNGEMTGQLAIRVHLTEKKPLSELSEEELFPSEIEGVTVDVIEAIYGIQLVPEGDLQVEAAVDGRGERFDPVPLGVSISNKHTTAGTLGAKVIDNATEAEMILSNWHVMVGVANPAVNLATIQPGRLDGGQGSDTIATLSRYVLGPFDAAVAQVTGARSVQSQTLEGAVIEDTAVPQLGMMVWKSGRTTGRTEGFIDGIHMSVSITYSVSEQLLQQVFRIVPRPGAGDIEVSQGGDSGAIWVDEASGKAVGLHFAGEVGSGPEQALANNLESVLQHLSVHLPAQAVVAPPPVVDDGGEEEKPPDKSFWQRIWDFIVGLFN
jgi:hypothetical protein